MRRSRQHGASARASARRIAVACGAAWRAIDKVNAWQRSGDGGKRRWQNQRKSAAAAKPAIIVKEKAKSKEESGGSENQ
jgi:hypothetical protein